MTGQLAGLMLAVTALLLSQSALAGNMFFGLCVSGAELTLTNQGTVSAFYPAVVRMLPDGNWPRLEASRAPELYVGITTRQSAPEVLVTELVIQVKEWGTTKPMR